MTAPDLWDALLAGLDDEHAAQLAERLRSHHTTDRRLLTATEAAQRLGLHPKTVVRMAREGRLPAIRIGNGWRFDPDQLHIAQPPRRLAPVERSCSPPRRRPVKHEPASVRAIRGERSRRDQSAA